MKKIWLQNACYIFQTKSNSYSFNKSYVKCKQKYIPFRLEANGYPMNIICRCPTPYHIGLPTRRFFYFCCCSFFSYCEDSERLGKIWTMFTEQMRDKSKNISVVMDEFGKCRLPFLLYYLVYTQNIEKNSIQLSSWIRNWVGFWLRSIVCWYGLGAMCECHGEFVCLLTAFVPHSRLFENCLLGWTQRSRFQFAILNLDDKRIRTSFFAHIMSRLSDIWMRLKNQSNNLTRIETSVRYSDIVSLSLVHLDVHTRHTRLFNLLKYVKSAPVRSK